MEGTQAGRSRGEGERREEGKRECERGRSKIRSLRFLLLRQKERSAQSRSRGRSCPIEG
jgi:hypothetical protein